MVRVQPRAKKSASSILSSDPMSTWPRLFVKGLVIVIIVAFVVVVDRESSADPAVTNVLILSTANSTERGKLSDQNQYQCPYMKFGQLSQLERYPHGTDKRYIVDPPLGGNQTLVCCQTTVGPWNIFVHEKWAPIGARRFLKMVESGYFSLNQPQNTTTAEGKVDLVIKGGVPLMRCVHSFLCQFGLAGSSSKLFDDTIPDDPNWLPEGPTHRKSNVTGVKRFSKGFMAYAGSGPSSRSNQLIVSLHDDGRLGGGSPWEVPFGELVGPHSFQTLDSIYTGYDEKGPPQGLLYRENALEQVARKWPLLDAVLSCRVVDNVVDV
jgi:peptidyl-prolyl cis-trans isomerase A (cyclophilin A)